MPLLTKAERAAAQVRRRRRIGLTRRKRKRVPAQRDPRGLQRDYARALIRFIARTMEAIQPALDRLPGLIESAAREREDVGEVSTMNALLNEIADELKDGIANPELASLATRFGRDTISFQKRQFDKQIRATLGVDLLMADQSVPAILDGFVSEQVEFMRDLGDKLVRDIRGSATRAIRQGTRASDVAKEIQKRHGIARNRARLIARDQIATLNGEVNRARQRELGIDKFVWRTVGDERVRDDHEVRDGEIYSWSNPPNGEIPGQPINCRCTAEPVISGIESAV